jgi:hypothetical protein
MTVTVKSMIGPKYAEASTTIEYTASNVKTLVDKFTVTNTGAADATLSVYFVPSSGTAGNSNLILDARAVAPGETYICPEIVGHVVPKDYSIRVLASASSTLTIMASGREVS